MVMRAKASLDNSGNLVEWNFGMWSDTHSTRPGGAGSTLVGQHIALPFPIPPAQAGSQPAGFAILFRFTRSRTYN
jgi:hypothetical protein